MAYSAHHPDLYRLCRAGAQLWSQLAVSAAGASSEIEKADQPDLVSTRPGSDRPDRIPVPATGLPLHDAGTADGFGGGSHDLWARRFPRSENSSRRPDVGGVHGDGVHALELRMARTPRRVPGNIRLCSGAGSLGGQLFLRDPQVRCLMRFQLIGVNHKSAPLEVRERLAIPDSRLPDTCRELAAYPGIEEGMVISTCNRVEVVTHTVNGHADLRGFLHDHFHLKPEELDAHLYEFRDKDAVRHLFRVAASLDSMVIGEAQILGQVKEAYATARAVGAVRGQLDQLFSRAFAVAKRVRSETAVGSSSVSIASVAVELAKKIFGTLQGKNVFIIGAGKMSELAARHLMAHGCASIFVANRTYERAIGLAQKFNGQAIKFEDLYNTCDRADIVITSTGAPHAIFRREHGEQFLSRRKNRPMFFIDIAVPRDVSPEMGKLDGIFAYDIDDLQQAVSSHVADRRKEAERAEAIIASEVERFEARLHTLDVVPTIVSLQDHLETIRQAEIDRVRGRLGQLSPEQEIAVEALTRGIINKVMHTPITTLKSAAKESEATTVVDVVRRLFNLQVKGKDAQEAASGKKDEVGTRP